MPRASSSSSASAAQQCPDADLPVELGRRELRSFLEGSHVQAAVTDFQRNYAVQSEVLEPALNLLDLHAVPRGDFYEAAMLEMQDRLLTRIRGLAESQETKKLDKLLEKCFRFYRIVQIRPVVLEVLKRLRKVPEKYLKHIQTVEDLYADCDVIVKQQIWLHNTKLFRDAIASVLDSYIFAKRRLLNAPDPSTTTGSFFTRDTTKTRRQWTQVQELVRMVGDREELYGELCTVIRERFASSGDWLWCALRTEIVMAAHDANVETVVKMDACHDLAWTLDTCLRDKHLDVQQTHKLKQILDSFKATTDLETLIDYAMLAGDPHVTHLLCSMAVKILRDQCSGRLPDSSGSVGHLPRDAPALQLLVRVIAFGAQARTMAQTKAPPTHLVDSILVTKFLPQLGALIAEDAIRIELQANPTSSSSGGATTAQTSSAESQIADSNTGGNYLSPLSELSLQFLKVEPVASLLLLHQIADALASVASNKANLDLDAFQRYLPGLESGRTKVTLRAPWPHLIVHRLVAAHAFAPTILQNSVIGKTLLYDYLLANVQTDASVKFQLLRLAHQLPAVLGPERVSALLQTLHPDGLGDTILVDDREDYYAAYLKVSSRFETDTVTQQQQQQQQQISTGEK